MIEDSKKQEEWKDDRKRYDLQNDCPGRWKQA